ncbi:major capsid protein [Nocardia neocaledoniensis]|uniref:major capsid protein n=1 Tax=Nocardia neocaledoniensis TaxID=236511 RepID=UPI0024584FEB|nr:major capsid protein [Nocardia neocaledoniensis]
MDPITLQDLIDAAAGAAEGQTPAQAVAELLAGAPAGTDVDALLNEAITRFGELHEGGVNTDDELAAVEALADVTDGVRVEVARREQIAGERADRIKALADRITPPAENDAPAEGEAPADGGEGSETAPAAESTDAPADPAPAPVAEAPAVEAPAAEAAAAPELVTASASRPAQRRRVRLADLPRREVQAPQADESHTAVVITAAADVEGYSAGSRMEDFAAVARAGTAKFESFPDHIVPNTRIVAPFASFRVPFPDDLVVKNDKDAEQVMDHAVDQSRLPQPITAAGTGWCSPSERLYEMSPILADGSAGLVDLAEVQSPRGGLTWTEGPDYTAIYNGTGFIQTEAQNIAGTGFTTAIGGTVAGTSKPIFDVPCPASWDEERAEAVGFGIAGGILQHDAYPELTEDIVSHALVAHAHRVNARSINRMVAESGSAVTLSLGPSATPQVLNSIDIQIEDLRYANRIGDGVTLKVMLPRWLKAVVRADQSIRTAGTAAESYDVEDAKINAWFAKRNAIVEWVYDWQDAFTGVASGFGGASPITSWPTTVDALVYLPQTFLRSRGDIINMQAVYDTNNLPQNRVLHLFVEEKLMVIKRRYKPRLLRIALSANGSTAAGQILDANGKIVVTP